MYRRMRKLAEFWAHPTGPGTVACEAVYAAQTAEGRRMVACLLRRRATEPAHDDLHYGLSGGSWPVRWA